MDVWQYMECSWQIKFIHRKMEVVLINSKMREDQWTLRHAWPNENWSCFTMKNIPLIEINCRDSSVSPNSGESFLRQWSGSCLTSLQGNNESRLFMLLHGLLWIETNCRFLGQKTESLLDWNCLDVVQRDTQVKYSFLTSLYHMSQTLNLLALRRPIYFVIFIVTICLSELL